MAGQDDGDDFFSDDELDDLPPDALDELENNALRQTQHQTQATVIIEHCPSSDYGDEFDDEDLDDAVVIDETRGVPNRFPLLQPLNASLGTQRRQFGQSQYGGPNHQNPLATRPLVHVSLPPKPTLQQHNTRQSRFAAYVPNTERQEVVSTPAISNEAVDTLQQHIQELLQERDNLKQQVDQKSGEIAIVRSKHEKATKEFQRELTTIRQLNAERLAEQDKIIEAVREAEKTKATELEFIKRDLFDETEKVRNMSKAQEKSKRTVAESITTPKKNKTPAYRDGFDDDEIQFISPSKFLSRKSNPSTPTKTGAKRKRKGPESPVPSLEVAQEEHADEVQAHPASILNEALLEKIQKPDDRLDFLEAMFDHRPHQDHLRTFEEFAKLSFPSSPMESFASIILGKLPAMSLKRSASEFPVEFCELIISLWSGCLDEKYYKPVYLLVDLLTFALELKTLAISPFVIDRLLTVAQLTCELIAIPRFRQEPTVHLEKDIDPTASLAIIHLAALGCVNNKEYTIRVWKILRIEFVLAILSQQQSPKDFDIMLQLLSMSTMKDSFGPKALDQDLQQLQAIYIIERISLMLIGSPSVREGSPAFDPSVISNLRLQILRTLNTLSQTVWGGEVIAAHGIVIGRLVKFMSDELELLYNYHSGHKQSAVLISLSARLLHHLVTKHDKHINMQEKLSGIPGGMQKYLICLARLTFSEDGLVLDADISPEVAECAHEMLELAVSPEEGDVIHSAFSST